MLESSIRTLAALFFSVVVCAGFLAFLTVSNLKSTVLEPSFYTTVLDQHNSYETIHTGLLSELEEREELQRLQDDLGVGSDEFTELAREVVPVSYVKAQLDVIITDVLSYLRGEAEDPQVFIDFAGPLERMRPASLDFLDRRVDSAELTYPTTAEEYALEVRHVVESVERGNIPRRVPSLANIPSAAIESAFDHLTSDFNDLLPLAAASFEASLPEVKSLALAEPDSREAMKLASHAVVSPAIDEAVAMVRSHLDEQDRFDLVEAAAEASDIPRDQFVEDVDEIRDPVNTLQGVGPTVALLVMAFATLGLVLVNLPHRTSMIVWPGITLIVAGFLAILISALLTTFLPEVSPEICGDAADFACVPAVDILRELTRSLADFPILPSILVILIGGLGIVCATVVVAKGASGAGSRKDW